MKYSFFISFIFLIFISNITFSQVKNDTLLTVVGEKVIVSVKEITASEIKYSYPNEALLNGMKKSSVAEIRFGSGRVQKLHKFLNYKNVSTGKDWENVSISNVATEVEGLVKLGDVSAKAEGTTEFSSVAKLQARVYDKIKVQSAMLGGNVAFVINQTAETMSSSAFSSKAANAIMSASVYSSKVINSADIHYGTYSISHYYLLRSNEAKIKTKKFAVAHQITISEDRINLNGRQPGIDIKFSDITNGIEKMNIISSTPSQLVLSYVKSTSRGKKTYYNIILTKIVQ
ncbi:hypothetical protein [Flammeovirga pacifica]|uniref:Uncharacterized protein n=1 Tax=Flammeovirga pacifica TaxID=915059 RepID=A0A1S1YVU4_FLAPC|nr:hypothetical protein [Flammeovirga pacifica]OHX65110.1 hypothetical protein NH26_01450 [Flammeovirga pacifica]